MKIYLYIFLFLPILVFSQAKELIITGDKNYAPYTYLDAHKKPQGMLVDMWDEWSKVTGIPIKYQFKDWVQSVKAIKSKEVDIHSGMYNKSLDTSYFSDTIHRTKVSLFALKGYTTSLTNQKVGVIDPDFASSLKKDYPNVEIVLYDNYDAIFQDIEENKLELFFDSAEPVVTATTKTDLDVLIGLLTSVSNVVHFLQQERGASSGYISSDGKRFKTKLTQITQNTDSSKRELLSYLKKYDALLKNYLSEDENEKILALIEQISSLRKGVKDLSVDFPQAYSKYTQIIATLLLKLSDLSNEVKNKDLSDKLYTYSMLLLYKESLGQKRAALSALFSQKIFSKEIYEYFLTSDTQEKIYIKSFLRNADANSRENYFWNLDYEIVQKVKKYESLALEKFEGKEVDVDPEKWFEDVTKKINLVQGVEKTFYSNILNTITKLNVQQPEKRLTSNPYEIVPLEKEYYFNLRAVTHNKELNQKIKDGFRKISVERMIEIEKKWIAKENSYYSKSIFTQKELHWIKNAKVIKVGGEMDWAPFDFVDEKGKYQGISKDYMELVAEVSGLKLEYITSMTWSELLQNFKEKKLDILPAIYYSKEREKFVSFTSPYYDVYQYIFAKDTLAESIKGLEDLPGKRVAIVTDYIYEQMIRDKYPDIEIVRVNSLREGITSVITNKAEAYIDNYTVVDYYLRKELINGIEPAAAADFGVQKLYMGVQPEKNILQGIINKALENISFDEKKEITSKWGSILNEGDTSNSSLAKKTIHLSKEEKNWLKKHSVIRFTGDPNWLPFEAVDSDGKYIGIVSEHLKLIESMLPISFEFVATSGWDESVALAKDGKVDLLSETTDSDLISHLNFTNSYLTTPVVIVMDSDHGFVDDLVQIADKKIAVIDGYGYLDRIYKEYPMFTYHKVSSIQEGLLAVSTGEVDALLCTLPLAGYTISTMALSNVKIVGKTEFTTSLGFGISKKLEPLVPILNRAIESISDDEHHQIVKQWSSVVESDTDYTLILQILFVGFGVSLALVYWNRQLKKRVDEKTSELQALLRNFDENVIASRSDLSGRMTYVSKAFAKISAYAPEELLHKPHSTVRHPDTPKEVFQDLWSTIQSGKIWNGEIKNLAKDGSSYWVDATITPEFDEKGNIVAYSAIRHDITATKKVEELTKTLEHKVEKRTKELSDQMLLFENLFSASPDAITLLEEDGTHSDCNEAALSMFGVDTKESYLKLNPELLSPELQPCGRSSEELVLKRIDEAVENGKSIFEWRSLKQDTNEEFDAEVVLAPFTYQGKSFMYVIERNISERKAIEREMAQNTELMTFVSEYASFGFWHFNPQVGDLYVNDVFVQMLGYDPEDVLVQGYDGEMFKPFKDGLAFWEQLLHPEDVEPAGKAITAHINGETELYKVDYRMRRADGSWMWSTAIGRIAEHDDEGKAIRFNGVNIDTSESKEAQNKIESQQQQFSSMTSNVPGVIYRCKVDAEWTMNYISNEIETLVGYPVSDFINNEVRSFADIMYKEDIPPVAKLIQEHINKGKKFLVDFRVVHKDGTVKWVRNQGQAVTASEDGNKWLDGVLFDVTKVKKDEDDLKHANFMADNALDLTKAGFWHIDLDDQEWYTSSERAAKIFGDHPSEGHRYKLFEHWAECVKAADAKVAEHTFAKYAAAVAGDIPQYDATYAYKRPIDGEIVWIRALGHVVRDEEGKPQDMWGVAQDVTEFRNAQKAIESEKQFTQTLLDSQEQIIITTDGQKIVTANETFYDFFAIDSLDEFQTVYDAKCICDTFNTNAPKGYLQINMENEEWIDYVISRSAFGEIHKAMITRDGHDFIFSATAAKLPGDNELKSAVFTNITEMENAKLEVERIHKHTQESIEYASLIQGALIPDNTAFRKYFQDYFAIWHPKDTIGGDIYLFEELRDSDECLLMVIDCTGHGVPGAFVTMLVKAIERQIIGKINNDKNIDVSPAWILSYFNRQMKTLLNQNTKDSISNAGFDGGVIYYNKKEKVLKFAGAETPLFYQENNELNAIKGNRHSIGYKNSDSSYEFTDHVIEVKEGMQFYCTTDGYLDQNGGEKSFPFGKKRFKNIINEYHIETMADQQEVFLNELALYQGDEDTNDDVTLVGFKI